jgi:ubiquinone/menaquinone biosynthesis C-methylase UbiE
MKQSIWADDDTARFLRLRIKTFYNMDYFERIVLPLLDLPSEGHVLDIGCGYGGLSLLLARARSDLHIRGVDLEQGALESAASIALQEGLDNLSFQPGDGHQLEFSDDQFDAVMCQTVLTHVREAVTVISEMVRVLKPGGVFMAAEYTDSGAWTRFDNQAGLERDEAWHQKYFRVLRLFAQGKRNLGRGDEQLGVRIPALVTAAGLEVFDVRLNDRVMHVIPPYRYLKQKEYVELLEAFYAPDRDSKGLLLNIESLQAAGGSQEEAEWLYNARDNEAIRQALEARILSMVSAYMLYLTFAKKPIAPGLV